MRSSTFRLFGLLLLVAGLTAFASGAMAQTVINEIRIDQTSTDNDEYFELKGTPLASLTGLTYLVIGDGTGASGVIEAVVDLTGQSLDANGYFVAAEATFTIGTANMVANLNFENSDNTTHVLVQGFTGLLNDDLDTNDDGVLDVTPWTSIVDLLAVIEEANPPAATEYHYGPPTIGPDGTFAPGHVYRCPDIASTWKIGAFEIVGGQDTPGAENPSCLSPAPSFLDEARTPCVPVVSQAATVQAVVTNATSAKCFYQVNAGATTELAMTPVATSGDTTTFEAAIPGQAANGDLVEYSVRAYNANPDSADGYAQGYFVGTNTIGSVQVNDVDGRNIYKYYGVRFNGVVTAPFGLYQTANTEYVMQDATGGITVFQYGLHSVQPALGDDITVEGAIDQYNGKLEISPVSACDTLIVEINGPGTVPAPLVVNTCDLGEAQENMLVQVQIATLVDNPDTMRANTNHRVSNCIPDTLIVRVDGDTNIDPLPVTSQYVTVTGIASQFDSSAPYNTGYQLLPRYLTDITFIASTAVREPVTKPVARLLQNFPNPFSRTTDIRYTVPAGAAAEAQVPVKIRVFDVQGRVVTTLVDGLETPGDHTVTLSREALGGLGNGIYFYQLDVADQSVTRKLVLVQ